ncbi:MAG: hypothetical protein AB7T05_12060, partial [Fimbriimonadaceae bacterium]
MRAVGLALLLLPGLAPAQDEVYWRRWRQEDNFQVFIEIQTEAPDPPLPDEAPSPLVKVSGTNVNVKFTGGGGPDANWNGAQTYDAARLDKIEFSVSGAGISTDTLTKAFENTPNGVARIRFASTRFAHGTDIELRAKAFVSLKKASGGSWVQKTVEHDLDVDAYNTVQRLATHEIVNAAGQYEFDPDPTAFEYSYVSSEGTNQAQQLLGQPGLNHQLQWPSGIADNEQQESELAEHLDESTVNVLFTHGEPALFRSSYDDGNPANGDDRITIPEVTGYVARAAGIPLCNLTLMYACSYGASGHEWAEAFGAEQQQESGWVVVPNRAWCGFDQVVYSDVYHENWEG